jgi:hypothetical protein
VSAGHCGARCIYALLIASGLALLGVVAVVLPWKAQMGSYQDAAEASLERLTKLRGLDAQKPLLEQRLATFRKDIATSELYLRATTPALASAELQGRVKKIVESASGSLVSTQALQDVEEGGARRVSVQLRMTGDINALAETLYGIEAAPPLLFVDNLTVNVQRARRARKPRGQETAPSSAAELLDVTCDISVYLLEGTG